MWWDMSNIPMVRGIGTVAGVDQLRDYAVVAVGGEVEVAWDSVDLEKSFHPASLLFLDVLHNSLENLLIAHT